MQVMGWDWGGMITFNDVVCQENTAVENGGCFYGTGGAIFNEGATLRNNVANNGACICERNVYDCLEFTWSGRSVSATYH